MTTAPLLLDTCAILWSATGVEAAPRLRAQLRAAHEQSLPLWMSPISAWEIGILASSNRISLARPTLQWFQDVIFRAGAKLADLNAKVLVASTELPGELHRDPADRIIVATAREYGLRVVTRDRKILDYARHGHVMAMEC
jgi:PIN domain nuclease of toxin-antitoxin system